MTFIQDIFLSGKCFIWHIQKYIHICQLASSSLTEYGVSLSHLVSSELVW